LTLTELKKHIPAACFQKSLPRSLFYMVIDLLLLSSALFVYDYFSSSWIGLFVYWNIYGFLMWCLFVVGHDCGHGTFSNYPIINAICGHICHAPLLVPFFPWAYSHRKHHRFHNHKDKDMSHPWLTKEEVGKSFLKKYYLSSVLSPFLSYLIYLYVGEYDGSHVTPTGRLYQGAGFNEKMKCFISSLSILCVVAIFFVSFSSWSQFMLSYGGCWLMFSFWLFMVTYMQHHDEKVIAYDDSNWDFFSGALQTVDRKFGFGIDRVHHNITDGHVVHHLFFTQIPHYHLKRATKAIAPLLKEQYKFVTHKIFFKDFWSIFFKVKFSNWNLNKLEEPKETDSNH